ncbi:MAG: nucleoside deaminase [Proteobacteria bacterium]|nr:nucleoside deaminase [Pseudomonadota bacterium]
MFAALEQAKIAISRDEVPVGAVLVKNKKIIASNFNRNRSLSDPTAHAEILVIRESAKILGSHRLDGCDIYVTLEPCIMCAAAISLARIRRIYYSASDEKFGAVESGFFTKTSSCYHRPEIYSGFCEKDSALLLKNFFEKKR